MKRKLIVGLLVLSLLAMPLFAIACEEEEEVTPPAEQEEEEEVTPPAEQEEEEEEEVYHLVVSDHNPADQAPSMTIDTWAEYLEQESGGRLELEVIHGAALFTGDEIFGQLQAGGCDAGPYALDREDGFLLNLVLTLPFLGWPEQHYEDSFWALMDEFPEYAAEWEGVTIISVMIMPGTQLHTVDKVIATPDDIAGVKMFCAEAILVDIIESVGGVGVELPINDMAQSVSTGVVDGVFNHFPVTNVFGALEMLPYHTVFGGGINFTPMFMLMSTESLNALPSDLQDLIINSGDVWLDTFTELDGGSMAEALALCEADNHTFTYLTLDDIAQWRALIQEDVFDTWIADCEAAGLPGQAVYDRVLEMIEELSS